MMEWILLYLLTDKTVQEHIFDEMNSVVGNRKVTLADKAHLHYLNAFIEEVMRHCPGMQLSVPHSTSKDTYLGGHFIPKGTTIFQCNYGINFDNKNFDNPEEFRPSRFLNGDGKYVPNEHNGIFGIGRRRCVGEALARAEVFLFLANLVLSYKLLPCLHEKLPDLNDFEPTIPGGTKPFSFTIQDR